MQCQENYPFTAPSSTVVSENLLFFDTFSHTGLEKKLNFDLVQFPSPVVIDLIKIVPLGQPIEAKIPGNVRLGATNPSDCELEFFINDLSRQDAHTMTDLGKFYCSEKVTDFNPPLQIQTDGLLLRGSYRTLTLAIFGQIATYDDKTDEEQPIILSAASPPAQTPASPVGSDRDLSYVVRDSDRVVEMIADTLEGSESTLKSAEIVAKEESPMIDNESDAIAELSNSDPFRDRVVALEELSSDGEPSAISIIQDSKKSDVLNELSNSLGIRGRSPVRSKDIKTENSSNEYNLNQMSTRNEDYDELSDEFDESVEEWSFDIDNYLPKVLTYFADPSLSLQERSLNKRKASSEYDESTQRQIAKLKEMFDSLLNDDPNQNEFVSDEWVTLMEDLYNDITNMSLVDTIQHEEMLKFLIEQINIGLDIRLAVAQRQTGFKVRHLRAGIKLATILFHCGGKVTKALLDASIPHKLLNLYAEDQMSLPIRLLIFKCLNSACDNVLGVEHIINHKESISSDSPFTIREIRKMITNQTKGLFQEIKSDPITKSDGENSDSTSVPEDAKPLTEHTEQVREEESLTCYQIMILLLLSKQTTRITIAIGNLIKKIRLYRNFSNLREWTSNSANHKSTSRGPEVDDESSSVDNGESDLRLAGSTLEKIHKTMQDIIHLFKDASMQIVQPVRYLPAKIQFQVKPNPNDPYLAIYRWLKHFRTLDLLNSILSNECRVTNTHDGLSNVELDQSIRLKGSCLTLIQVIIDSPCGMQLLLSEDLINISCNILNTLREKQASKRPAHLRMSADIENGISASLLREESQLSSKRFDLALRLAYNFKVLSSIDKLFRFHRESIAQNSDPGSAKSNETTDPEKVLHQLYIISDHPYGLDAIVQHFSCIGNLDCLLRFLDMPDYHKRLEFVKETSTEYALELIGAFFRLNNNVLAIVDEYLETLLELCKTKDKTVSTRIKSLIPWLSPFDSAQPIPPISYSDDTFRNLMRVIRKSIPNYSIPFAKGLDYELPPRMITAVRILRQLCIPPQVESFIEANFNAYSPDHTSTSTNQLKTSHSFMAFVDGLPHQQNQNQSWNLNSQLSRNQNSNNLGDESIIEQLGQINSSFKLFHPYEESICGELKFHYGIMQVFEQEGLKRLLNTLRELIGNYPHPSYQSSALSGLRGRIVISYIHSVVVLLKSIVFHLIDARGSEFQDTSVILVILETYSLLCFVPKPETSKNSTNSNNNKEFIDHSDLVSLQKSINIRASNYELAHQTKKLILSILMSYTQMCLSVSDSEEKFISKSLWTRMLREVMDFTLSTPVFFHHGLDIITKILPSPLPCSSMMDSIDQEQLFKNINHRKLWSAHLHPLHQHIEQMISNLSICYQSEIRQLIYYFCNQLCDLSSNAASLVAKIITTTLTYYSTKLVQADPNLANSSMNSIAQQTTSSSNTISPLEQTEVNQTPLQSSSATGLQSASTSQPDERLTSSAPSQVHGVRECSYACKMLLSLLSNLITNQAFETALTNHLQVVGKKDEKLLVSIQSCLKQQASYRPGEASLDEQQAAANSGSSSVILSLVNHLVDSIKSIGRDSISKEGFTNPKSDLAPPDELTKIDLLEMARRTSTNKSFNISTSLAKTYRLKVLLDLNSRSSRTAETSVPFSTTNSAGISGTVAGPSKSEKRFEVPYSYQEPHAGSRSASRKTYAPPRSRARGSRPDSFRSRSQNTSRPPSIHVDEFIDLYGDKSAASSSLARYHGASSKSSLDYRSSTARSYNPDLMGPSHQHAMLVEQSMGRQSYFSPPPPPQSKSSSSGYGPSGSPSSSSRSKHSQSKFMKLK